VGRVAAPKSLQFGLACQLLGGRYGISEQLQEERCETDHLVMLSPPDGGRLSLVRTPFETAYGRARAITLMGRVQGDIDVVRPQGQTPYLNVDLERVHLSVEGEGA
jgi:hypothetical protein